MNGRSRAAVAALCLLPHWAPAAEPGGPTDWPCQQPLVPAVSAEMVWGGPPLGEGGDWRTDRPVAALVAAVSPIEVPVADGKAEILRFLDHHRHDRKRAVARLLAGLIEESNRERQRVVDHIELLAERQRRLAEMIAGPNAAPTDADGQTASRWSLAQRAYGEGERSLRYACEAPARLDQRLGIYARILEAATSGEGEAR